MNLFSRFKLPIWYILGIVFMNVVGLIIYFSLLGSNNFNLIGALYVLDLVLIFIWLLINSFMIFYLISKKASSLSFIMPIYFTCLYVYLIIQLYLAYFQNIFVPKGVNDVLTILTTIFELGMVAYLLYKYKLVKDHDLLGISYKSSNSFKYAKSNIAKNENVKCVVSKDKMMKPKVKKSKKTKSRNSTNSNKNVKVKLKINKSKLASTSSKKKISAKNKK